MTRVRRWRLRPLLLSGVVVALVPALFLAEQGAERILRRAISDTVAPEVASQILRDVRIVFLALLLLTLLLAACLAWFLSARLVADLRRMRADTLARSRGPHAITSSHIREFHTLGKAIDLLATELQRYTETLARERTELALLVSAVSEGILQVGPTGRIVHANPAVRALLGIREDSLGAPLSAIVRQEDLRALIDSAVQGEDPPPHEITLDERRLLVAARPVRSADTPERSGGAVIAFTDLTQVRRLEGVRRDFVANVSHELKTPLTSIRGYAETLLSDDLPPHLQREFLQVIQNNAERLHGIVDDLLDLSRLESGGWRPQPGEVAPLEIARELWHEFRSRRAGKRIEFDCAGDDVLVRADPGALRHVLSNLLDNAIRHTPDGGRITVRAQSPALKPVRNGASPHDDDRVIVEIQDTGTGIPQEALPRIFERFYRVDPARSRAEGGTGLGLAIVKHLVESMGGDVTAESELGKGTVLRLRLPAAAVTAS
jgi:signal transduction histidine kinase